MKTQERTKPAAEEPRWYTTAAHPSTPGGMMKAEPDDLAQAEDEENADAGKRRRRMRWVVVLYVVIATGAVALGNVFDSIYWAAIALFFAVAAQPRERAPKLLQYFSIAAIVVLTIIMFARFITEH